MTDTEREIERVIESFLDERVDASESVRVSMLADGEALTLGWSLGQPFSARLRLLPTAVFVPEGLVDPDDRGLREMIWGAAESRGLRVFMNNPLLNSLAQGVPNLPGPHWSEEMSNRWKPERLSTLLIGESPGERGALFFYTYDLARKHDELYRAVVNAVLNAHPGRAGADKEPYLDKLREVGIFLIDMSREPVGNLDAFARAQRLQVSMPDCLARVQQLAPSGVIICDPLVHELLSPHLGGLLLHTDPLPFPQGPDRAQFIGGVRRALGSPSGDTELSSTDMGPRFRDALALTYRLHGSQVRKGSGVPYIGHLLGVASIVIDAGGNEDLAIAALLHDAIEDAGGERARLEIEGRFGSRVANIVADCSDTDERPKPPWRERKQRYLEHMESVSQEVLLVSLADKLHNVRAMLLDYNEIGDELWSRFKTDREAQLWYYRSLAHVFCRRSPGALADELSNTVKLLTFESTPGATVVGGGI